MTQKTRGQNTRVLTANRLLDGEVVYKTADDGWSETVRAAELLRDEAQEKSALLWAEAQEAQCVVTGSYLIEVLENETITPVSLRETIRAQGPTSEQWVGKQSVT